MDKLWCDDFTRCKIGKGSIISAGSVVTSDVPPGMVYQNKVEPQLRPLNK